MFSIVRIGLTIALLGLGLAALGSMDSYAEGSTVTGLVAWEITTETIDGEQIDVLTVRNLTSHNVELLGVSYRPCGLNANVRENRKALLWARVLEGDLLMAPGAEHRLRMGAAGKCYEKFELRYCGATCAEVEVVGVE